MSLATGDPACSARQGISPSDARRSLCRRVLVFKEKSPFFDTHLGYSGTRNAVRNHQGLEGHFLRRRVPLEKSWLNHCIRFSYLAEREGFEPPVALRLCLNSSPFFALLQTLAKRCKNERNAFSISGLRWTRLSHEIAEKCKKVANQQPPALQQKWCKTPSSEVQNSTENRLTLPVAVLVAVFSRNLHNPLNLVQADCAQSQILPKLFKFRARSNSSWSKADETTSISAAGILRVAAS